VTLRLPASLAGGARADHRFELPLLGAHQRRNAMTAVAAAEALAATGLPLSATAIVDGLSATHWPGRLEVLRRSPLLIVDGAHNPESASRLREALASHFPGRRLTLVLGILGDKDIEGIAAELAPAAARVIVTAPRQVRAAPIDRLVAAVEAAGGRPEVAATVAEALECAFASAAPDDMICLTGSLTTVAEARAWAGRSET
jgi:dihydrofolate synthase/folylpolyglutamate synthase